MKKIIGFFTLRSRVKKVLINTIKEQAFWETQTIDAIMNSSQTKAAYAASTSRN